MPIEYKGNFRPPEGLPDSLKAIFDIEIKILDDTQKEFKVILKDTIDKRITPYLDIRRKILKKSAQLFPIITTLALLFLTGFMAFIMSKIVNNNSS